jgi:hypothetical protein
MPHHFHARRGHPHWSCLCRSQAGESPELLRDLVAHEPTWRYHQRSSGRGQIGDKGHGRGLSCPGWHHHLPRLGSDGEVTNQGERGPDLGSP